MSQQPNPPGTGRRSRGRRNRGAGRFVDESPQLISLPYVLQTAVNTYIEGKVTLPNTVMSNGKMLVCEFLRVYFQSSLPDFVANSIVSVQAHLGKKSKSAIMNYSDPDAIAYYQSTLDSGAARGSAILSGNTMIDLTDGKGNGVLVAAREIYLGVNSANSPGANVKGVSCKVLYRLKEVNVSEYVGIVSE